jgi:hypothetical protein
MAKKTKTSRPGALTHLGHGLAAVSSNLGILLFFMVPYAFLTAGIDSWIFQSIVGNQELIQPVLLKAALAWEGAGLLTEIVVGPLVAAATIYVARSWTQKRPASLSGSLNFALNRYRKMWAPHAGAQVSIRLGMLIIVPGILFLLQYAFVDAVAALEKQKWPMRRSTKLTRGRRKTLFLIFLPVFLISQGVIFADLWAVKQGVGMLALIHLGEMFMSLVMLASFYMVYEERTTAIAEAKKARAEADLPG